MNRKDKALELFKLQFNCAQAVFTAYRETDKLDEESALKLSTVLGAGMACTGREICGAASGALLAISMRHGRGKLSSGEAKAKTYDLGRHFLTTFERRMGSTTCESILGRNIGTPEGLAQARDMKLFETRCLDAVQAATDILEEIL